MVDGIALADPGKRVVYLPHRGDVVRFLEREVREGDLVVTMGAGDVYKIRDYFAAADKAVPADAALAWPIILAELLGTGPPDPVAFARPGHAQSAVG